ncbi:MAG TPA: hypothetical protein VEG27_13215 [Usitatibacter sp.]|nr:hypothetical protein [Usitatibacter sp.]
MKDSVLRERLFGALVVAFAVAACSEPGRAPHADTKPGEWKVFEGSWVAAGTVRTIPLGGERRASLADLSGTLMLAGPSRPDVGFRGEAIALTDSQSGMVGRAVWTDERGDQVFSELHGGGPAKGSHVTGTFIGGTGRYAGAAGSYEFTWEYVIAAEDGTVQGRAVGLKGRVRSETTAAPTSDGGRRP